MIARAIAVVASKGGVGKTTLCANLAVRAAKDSERVALLDADPQQALARWSQLRRAKTPVLVPLCENEAIPDIAAEVKRLKSKSWEYIFIDSPPALMHISEDVVMAADVVLIPVRASPIDLLSIDPTVELCESHGKPFAFALTHFDDKWKISRTALAAYETKGKVFRETIGYRSAYVSAMTGGLTGPEHPDRTGREACAGEIDALWRAVKRLAQTARIARA